MVRPAQKNYNRVICCNRPPFLPMRSTTTHLFEERTVLLIQIAHGPVSEARCVSSLERTIASETSTPYSWWIAPFACMHTTVGWPKAAKQPA